jgi:hypothetical protein
LATKEFESLQQLVHEITHNYHIETTKGLYCPRSIPYSLTNSGNEYSTLTSRRCGRINLCWFVTIGISCWSHSAQMDHGEAKYQSLGARLPPATILSTNLWIESWHTSLFLSRPLSNFGNLSLEELYLALVGRYPSSPTLAPSSHIPWVS